MKRLLAAFALITGLGIAHADGGFSNGGSFSTSVPQASSVSAGAVGIVQLSATGTPSATTFLRGDNTWAGITASIISAGTLGSGVLVSTIPNNVPFGGGAASSFLFVNTSTQVTQTASATNGQMLIGSTGANPAIGTIGSTANQTSVTPGAGTLTIGTVQSIGTNSNPQFGPMGIGVAAIAATTGLGINNTMSSSAGTLYGMNSTVISNSLGSGDINGGYYTAYINTAGTQTGSIYGAQYYPAYYNGTLTGNLVGAFFQPQITASLTSKSVWGINIRPYIDHTSTVPEYIGLKLEPNDPGIGVNPASAFYHVWMSTVPSGGWGIYSAGGKNTFLGGITGSTAAVTQSAGNIGEIISSGTTVLANIASTGNFGNVVSVTVTTGDWDASGCVSVSSNSSTATGFEVAISSFSANTTTDHVEDDNLVKDAALPNTTDNQTICVPMYPLLLAGNTTIYLKVKGTYSLGQPQAIGKLKCRRRA